MVIYSMTKFNPTTVPLISEDCYVIYAKSNTAFINKLSVLLMNKVSEIKNKRLVDTYFKIGEVTPFSIDVNVCSCRTNAVPLRVPRHRNDSGTWFKAPEVINKFSLAEVICTNTELVQKHTRTRVKYNFDKRKLLNGYSLRKRVIDSIEGHGRPFNSLNTFTNLMRERLVSYDELDTGMSFIFGKQWLVTLMNGVYGEPK